MHQGASAEALKKLETEMLIENKSIQSKDADLKKNQKNIIKKRNCQNRKQEDRTY